MISPEIATKSKGNGLALVGYRGTGKTTVGRIVAARLERRFHDADDVLRRRFGRSVRSIFRDLGEPVFRDWEELVLAELTSDFGSVIATGGGAVVREANRQALREFGFIVWLSADPSVLLDRLRHEPSAVDDRPALTPAGTMDEVTDVLTARLPLYREVADAVIETGGRTPEEVAAAVLDVFPASVTRWPAVGDAT